MLSRPVVPRSPAPADPARPPDVRPTRSDPPGPPPGDTGLPDPEFWPADRRWRGPAGSRLVERLARWCTDTRAGVVLLLVAAVVAGLVWYRIGSRTAGAAPDGVPAASTRSTHREPADPTGTEPAGGGVAEAGAGSAGGARRRARPVTVHVAGAVTRPGVVELPAGSRVIDAVEAAGGARAEADLDRLNLAAVLADGQRVAVARSGEPAPPLDPGAPGATPAGAPAAGDGGAGGPLALNTATQAQLEALPGVGPVLAQSILRERERRGGFRRVDDLRSVRGIGDKRFAELAPLVTV